MINNNDKPMYIFKICLIGNGGVGKTCIARRLCLDTFDANTKLTIGIDFYTHDVPIIINGEKSFVRLSIWDFGGQEQFKKMFSYYIHGANGVFLVFSLFNLNNSLLGLNWWNDHLSKLLHKDVPKILVGCKSDLMQDPERVDELVIENFRMKHNSIPFYKTSSKDSINIHSAFLNMVESILKKNEFDYEKILKK
ncbi:MAG: GTP-binding protein [Candidatus Lokiarchaeota archaeon]|nr:GTP-binding protein [Candidatus Lokiarchaeota archaeon]